MAYGFSAVNESGVVQIDDNYYNMSLITKGTATLNTPHPAGAGSNMYYTDISYTGNTPILALKYSDSSASRGVAILSTTKSGNNWTFRIVAVGPIADTYRTVNYYIFDRPSTASGYGLEVRDSSGNVTFNSEKPLMDIYSTFDSLENNSTLSLPSGKSYAVAANTRITYQTTEDLATDGINIISVTYFYIDVFYTVDGQLTVWKKTINGFGSTFSAGSGSSYYPPAEDLAGWGSYSPVLIIDVSDL